MEPKPRAEAGLRDRASWKLGSIAEGAMKMFAGLAKRLKYPALASVPVSAVMLSRVDSVSPEQHLDEVAMLFTSQRVQQLPVMDHGVVLGVVDRNAVAYALQQSGPDALVAAAPCRHVVTVAPSDALSDVLAQLRAVPDSVALVVDDGSPVGVLTEESLIAYQATHHS